jgi:hypothetical protein
VKFWIEIFKTNKESSQEEYNLLEQAQVSIHLRETWDILLKRKAMK